MITEALDFYRDKVTAPERVAQAELLDRILREEFRFDKIECIETGCTYGNYDNFGLYLAKLCQLSGGKFSTVDINIESIAKSMQFFNENIGETNIEFATADSVDYLNSYQGSPNLVHLDSYDLDMTNPVASMLHGFLEFMAIKDKMPVGGICIIDDNYMKGTWIEWLQTVDGEKTGLQQQIDVTYEIVGKGALVYHWVKQRETEWQIIGDHYQPGSNIKVMLKKIR